jgi:uroporphyrin-III C-methyltransferase
MLITGHARAGHPAPDWAAIAAAAAQGMTLVVYMGIARLAELQRGLLGHLVADTPAAVVQQVGTPEQRQLLTTLGQLEADVDMHQMGSPAILIIGDVLRVRATSQQQAQREVA